MSEVEIFMNEDDFNMMGKENCLAVYNHKYDLDWLFGYIMVQRVNLLGGAKVVMKHASKYVSRNSFGL